MIHDEPFPLKQFSLWFLLIFCGIITAFLLFIALISIWMSLTHLHQDGFWMPLLVGIIGMGTTIWIFIVFTRFILGKMKGKDIINSF